MMGIKEYETVRTALLVAWNKIADQVPTTLRNAVDAGIAKDRLEPKTSLRLRQAIR